MPDIVDAIIVGGGPAGLGAALALCRQNHSVIIFDSGDYRNYAAGEMHMVATWDHRHPKAFRAAARAELAERYLDQCAFVDRQVLSITRVYSGGGGGSHRSGNLSFEARDEAGTLRRGSRVILATGSRDLLPSIDGFDECWGKGIFHCLFCHGHEERRPTSSAGILAIDALAEPSTLLRVLRSTKQFVPRVRIYTNGNTRVAALLREVVLFVPGCEIELDYIDRLEMIANDDNDDEEGQRSTSIRVVLHKEESAAAVAEDHVHAFVVYNPSTEQASDLVEILGVELDADGDIKLGAFQETSQSGIFAAGDCASPHKYFAAASVMGNMAGAGASQQLQADIKYT